MNKNEEISAYIDMCCLKNELIMSSQDLMIKEYNNKKDFEDLVHSTTKLLEEDSLFLLQDDDFINKLENVLISQRFNINDKELITQLNKATVQINELKQYQKDEVAEIRLNYQVAEEEERLITYDYPGEMLEYIAQDAIVLMAFEGKVADKVHDMTFFSSTNSFLKNCPEIYEDEYIKDVTITKLTSIYNKEKHHIFGYKKSINKTLVNVKKLK